ncbi:hypothetical protein MHK_000822 [Candidatus Magnetomorum sp. HK-1]|nr:hypothetical protein MHK_000822 [Candidatus Magnetomorum sp. HK-1]
MSTMINSSISELQFLLNQIELPSKTRIKIIFEDSTNATQILKQKRVLDAMKKLRGSGNGNLINVLLTDRKRDKQK